MYPIESVRIVAPPCLRYCSSLIAINTDRSTFFVFLFYVIGSYCQAIEKNVVEKDIAAFIKKEFDNKYNPTWHCIVGKNFGSYVTHESRYFIYFYYGQLAVLLYKSG